MTEIKIERGTRIASMMVDQIVMTFVIMLFFLPNMIQGFASAFEINHEQSNPTLFGGSMYFLILGFALYLCKDSFNGRSVAKRVLKLQIVDNKTGEVATPIKCFIRNIPIIVWPIEVIAALINPSRRIGDYMSGTRVVPFRKELEQPTLNFGQMGLSIILAYGLMLLLLLPFESWKSQMESRRINIIESSINEVSALETEQLFADSLGKFLTPDIRVYDHIQENADLKYVSCIFRLKENYLENERNFDEIKSLTLPLLLSKFPAGTFVGQAKYVYQQPGSIQTRTVPLDWRAVEPTSTNY